MVKPDLTARVTAGELVPDCVVDGDAAKLVGFYGKYEHYENDDDRDPETPHVPFGLSVFVHRVQYSA